MLDSYTFYDFIPQSALKLVNLVLDSEMMMEE